jgi:hypothetical protein
MPDQIVAISEATDGFSFAYLKELAISAVLQWMQISHALCVSVMLDQSKILHCPMKTELSSTPDRGPKSSHRALIGIAGNNAIT